MSENNADHVRELVNDFENALMDWERGYSKVSRVDKARKALHTALESRARESEGCREEAERIIEDHKINLTDPGVKPGTELAMLQHAIAAALTAREQGFCACVPVKSVMSQAYKHGDPDYAHSCGYTNSGPSGYCINCKRPAVIVENVYGQREVVLKAHTEAAARCFVRAANEAPPDTNKLSRPGKGGVCAEEGGKHGT